VLVARGELAATTPTAVVSREAPVISLIAEGPPGTVPDVRGLSAREAVRKLVTLGLSANLAGDGIVVSQSPEAGSPLDPATTCRLVLQRSPRVAAPPEHP
jgi:beta-lactam-binding protein with PASTA domain